MSNIVAPFTKKRILVCEVAQNIWDEMVPFPGSLIGKMIEPVMFLLYSKNKIWTISQSTKIDLVNMKINKKNILVLPMGFDAPPFQKKIAKTKTPTALFVGRLAEMKGIRDAILAISEVNKATSNNWTLNIIGRGKAEYENILKELTCSLNADLYVHFLGFVSEQRKYNEMSKSWVLLVPSSREGWGLIVPEANVVGTPVIAYKSPGLVDSVKLYAKENILVNKSYKELEKELRKIKKPMKIEDKIKPGWDSLSKKVFEEINSPF